VAAAFSGEYTPKAVQRAFRHLLDSMLPPLSSYIGTGDHVLLKVNKGCSGVRTPEERFTSHPLFVEAVIAAAMDCGARVSFGDDLTRTAHGERIWHSTGLGEVARRTGARLVNFLEAGAREVRSGLTYPRSYFITNAVFEADLFINVANCRSHANVILSGAIKNTFGAVIGSRKLRIHAQFPDPSRFAEVIADIHRVVRPELSFLDLTSVIEGHGKGPSIQPVGLIMASADPVALDTLAACAIGFETLPIWTTVHASRMGLGTSNLAQIEVDGIDWGRFEKKTLRYPFLVTFPGESLWNAVTRWLNNGVLKPRPVISEAKCTSCGDCFGNCAASAIHEAHGKMRIDLARCADCQWCAKVCPVGAVQLELTGLARLAHQANHRLRAVTSVV
jgi:uncharacterized protein (DUF362 family)/Pyruvate/2-oxoacid:ferredoxin oxidoreductase delta subunit